MSCQASCIRLECFANARSIWDVHDILIPNMPSSLGTLRNLPLIGAVYVPKSLPLPKCAASSLSPNSPIRETISTSAPAYHSSTSWSCWSANDNVPFSTQALLCHCCHVMVVPGSIGPMGWSIGNDFGFLKLTIVGCLLPRFSLTDTGLCGLNPTPCVTSALSCPSNRHVDIRK